MRSYKDRTTTQLGEDLAALSAQLASALCRWLVLLAEFDRREGWAEGGARSCAQWVSWRCAMSPGAAREHVRVALALQRLPRTAALFARGELSYSKVRAITRLEDVTREDELMAIARDATASQLERVVRGYRSVVRLEQDAEHAHTSRFVSLRHEEDGSFRLSGRLTAEEGAVLLAALDEARQHLWTQQREQEHLSEEDRPAGYADALLLLADTALASPELAGRSAPERHQVVLHVEADTLAGHLADGEVLAPSVVRRLCCDTTLVTALERGGRTIDVGRRTRAIPPALRRALQARDGGCRFPGCQARLGLDAHHIEHWADGGATSQDNLLTLCRHHHRALHEGGFTVTAAGEFHRPDGTRLEAHPRTACLEGRTRLRRRGVSAGTLAAGASHRYDPGLAVDALLALAPPG